MMNDFDVYMIDNEFISEDDVDSLSDVSMEKYGHLQENEELYNNCFNLNSEWEEKIKLMEIEYLLCVCSLMDVDPSEEEGDSGTLEVALLFAEAMPLKKSISIQKLS